MLGRTHMAIGVCVAAASAPLMYHVPHVMTVLRDISRFSLPSSVAKEVVSITAAALGSYVPDLDQQDSIAARRVERVGQMVTFICLILMLLAMKLTTSPLAWLCTAGVAFAVLTRRDIARQVALGLLVATLLYLGFSHQITQTGAFLLAGWAIGAMFTKHRTFTHSILGTIVFLTGIHSAAGSLYGGIPFLGMSLGYVLHICADLIADGTALLWPFPRRIGLPLVKTGGTMDHAIGVVAAVFFVLSLVRGGR